MFRTNTLLRRLLCKKSNSLLILALIISGCSSLSERLADVGKAPKFKNVNTYQDNIQDEIIKNELERGLINDSGDKPKKYANSLWRPGARAFFRDQRARGVGDILKVAVTINDSVKLDNKTQRTRDSSGNVGVPNVFGFENKFQEVLPEGVKAASLFSVKSKDKYVGQGKVDRTDAIKTTIAATVIKILPSSNLYIRGSQEVRVNYELREVTVEGIVRPEDISSENIVTLDQIAEARVSYGGRGQLSEAQQERYGKQVIDIISPF